MNFTYFKLTLLCTCYLLGFFPSLQAQNLIPIQEEKRGKYAISKNDSIITPYIFTELGPFTENCAFANQGEFYAYIDTNGNALTPWIYETVTSFENGFAIAGDTNGVGLINRNFDIVVPFEYARVQKPKLGLVCVQDSNEKWGVFFIDKGLQIVCEYDFPPIIVNEEVLIVIKDNNYGVINQHNKIIHPLQFQYINKRGMAYKEGEIQVLNFD